VRRKCGGGGEKAPAVFIQPTVFWDGPSGSNPSLPRLGREEVFLQIVGCRRGLPEKLVRQRHVFEEVALSFADIQMGTVDCPHVKPFADARTEIVPDWGELSKYCRLEGSGKLRFRESRVPNSEVAAWIIRFFSFECLVF